MGGELLGLLRAGGPSGEVATSTWRTGTNRAKSARSAGRCTDGVSRSQPWRAAFVTNGPTEATNNLIKRVKRAAFGVRRFASYRVQALLHAGRPDWSLLATINPR